MEANDSITINDVKSIFLSKTFWFNAITGIVALAAEVNTEMLTSLGLQPETQNTIMRITGGIVAIVNIYLRLKTNTGVSIKPIKKDA